MNKLVLVFILLSVSAVGLTKEKFHHFTLTPKLQNRTFNEKDSLMQKVWEVIKKEGLSLANKLTEEILEYNAEFPLGSHNTPAVGWNTGLAGEFGIKISRRVDPSLATEMWRVHDRLTITIAAGVFLKKLRESGDIEITDEALKLFAGITFSRSYLFNHFASSYKEGLTSDFDKLLFGFKYFNKTRFLDIADGEVLSKTDMMSAGLTLATETPSMYAMAGYGSGSIYFSKLNTISYHRPLSENRYGELDALRVSRHISKVVGSKLQLELQADFYKILKITILGVDFDINFTKNIVTNMTLGEEDIMAIKDDSRLTEAFKKLNRGRDPKKLPLLSNYITSKEEGNRVEEQLGLFGFIWGKHLGSSLERLIFETNSGKQYFHRYYEERNKIKKSLWQAIKSSRNVGKFQTREIENMVFEYQTQRDDIPEDEVIFTNPSQITFRISKEYKVNKAKSKYKRKTQALMNAFTSIDGGIIRAIGDNKLKAPYVLDLHAQIGTHGIKNLLTTGQWELDRGFEIVCAGKELDPTRKLKRSVKKCLKKIRYYFSIISTDFYTTKKISLKRLKKFLQFVSNESRNFSALKALFGESNVQLYGFFQANTPENKIFKTYFKEGQNQGFGLIKDFVRSIE